MDEITRIQRCFARKAKAQPTYRFRDLYSLVWKPSFLELALNRVLANKGSRSAGIDGITVKEFQDPAYRAQFIQTLSRELKRKTFRPSPGPRVYIHKSNGKQRPLGILTIKDRVVQMLLKMLLEPIFETDFLECSYGFRPGRRTMDCLVPIWRHVTRSSKHYWVVEGDIRACFDNVNHRILVGLLRKRVADKDVLRLIEGFLKAGVIAGQLFQRTKVGTQQGGILSPLLANLYLHQFDLWWWQTYGSLTRYERRKRRRQGLGHPILIRYADDWVLLWNGNKVGAIRLQEEARKFLENDLKLDLSESKTRITHVNDGFTFLGFDIRRYQGTHGKPIVLIRPSQENVRKFKAKIKALTRRDTTYQPAWYKVLQINQILRGWSAYYQHVNAKTTFGNLDWWVLNRVFLWARKKHGRPPWRVIRAKYRHRDPKGRINFVHHLDDGSPIWLYRMSDRPIRRYWVNWQRTTYADAGITTGIDSSEERLVEPVSYPAKDQDQARLIVRRRDKFTCQQCGNTGKGLHVHHNQPKSQGGTDKLTNLTTLCVECHRQNHKSQMGGNAKPTVNADGEPCAERLARTVRGAA
jgi:group II intron reverse transcriptase/maturase